uniref:Secreted protein n=1 Tax=Anguilla anguilla TaxID=7936 RepID=A0A0E9QE57_ANGAN
MKSKTPLFPRVNLIVWATHTCLTACLAKEQNYTLKNSRNSQTNKKEKVARRKPFSGQQHSCKTFTRSRGPQQP